MGERGVAYFADLIRIVVFDWLPNSDNFVDKYCAPLLPVLIMFKYQMVKSRTKKKSFSILNAQAEVCQKVHGY